MKCDIDSISFVSGSLSRIAHTFLGSQDSCRLRLDSKLNVITNKTTKSRWNIRTEKRKFNPSVFNTTKNKINLRSAPNIQIATMMLDNVEYSISIVLLDDIEIQSTAFNEQQLHAVYFLMNVVICNPSWFAHPYPSDTWTSMQSTITGDLVKLETIGKKGSKYVRQYLCGKTGIVFLTLLENAIFQIANNKDHRAFTSPGCKLDDLSHFRYHQNPKYTGQDKNFILKGLYDTIKYFAENMIFTCVTAGTKDQFRTDNITLPVEDRESIHKEMQEVSNNLISGLSERLDFRLTTFFVDNKNLFSSTNLILQIDIGFEFSQTTRTCMMYPSGSMSQRVIRASVDTIKKHELLDNEDPDAEENQSNENSGEGADSGGQHGGRNNRAEHGDSGEDSDNMDDLSYDGDDIYAQMQNEEVSFLNDEQNALKKRRLGGHQISDVKFSIQNLPVTNSIVSPASHTTEAYSMSQFDNLPQEVTLFRKPSHLEPHRIRGGGPSLSDQDPPEDDPNEMQSNENSSNDDRDDHSGQNNSVVQSDDEDNIGDHIPDIINDNTNNDDDENSEEGEESSSQISRDINVQALLDDLAEEVGNKTRFVRHPFHGTLGHIGNGHKFDLCFKVKKMTESHFKENCSIKVKDVLLHKDDRAIQGMQIYSPRERSLMQRKTMATYHKEMQGFSKLVISLLNPLNLKHMNETKYSDLTKNIKRLFETGCELLDWYSKQHSNASDHGSSEVRVEYCFAFKDGIHFVNQDTRLLPILESKNSSPLDAFVCAGLASVKKDIADTNNEIFGPLREICRLKRQDFYYYTPSMKTAVVYLAEKFQQKINSTDPGFSGVHKTLVDQGKVVDFGRAVIPADHKIALSQRMQDLSKLSFGVDPKLLPLCHQFDDNFDPKKGCKTATVNTLPTETQEEFRKLNDPTMLQIHFQKLAAFKSHIFFWNEGKHQNCCWNYESH